MASLTPGLLGMGTIIREESTKDSGLFKMALPGEDSEETILLDLFGVDRQMIIRGRFVQGNSGYANIPAFIAALDLLANGSQTGRTYTSDKTGASYGVLVQSVSWSGEEGDPNSVEYTINLTEGSLS